VADERLQKIIAQAGFASRRGAEKLITEGRVRVNGKVVKTMGTKADSHRDKIEVNGKRVVPEKPVYYILHKPREVISSLSDPEGRTTIKDLVKRIPERVYSVGRLDYHTSGALLLTNDGEMSDALLRPKAKVPKVYTVKFKGHLGVEQLGPLRQGVELDDGYTTQPAEAFVLREEARNTWIQITLTEGKNRQIHRMGDGIRRRVMRLARSSFAGISIEGLQPGDYRPLKKKELEKLKKTFLTPKRQALDAEAEESWLDDGITR